MNGWASETGKGETAGAGEEAGYDCPGLCTACLEVVASMKEIVAADEEESESEKLSETDDVREEVTVNLETSKEEYAMKTGAEEGSGIFAQAQETESGRRRRNVTADAGEASEKCDDAKGEVPTKIYMSSSPITGSEMLTPPLPPQPESRPLPPRSSSKPPRPRPRPPLPRPRPPLPPRSPSLISSRRARLSLSSNARESPALAFLISAFFSSRNVRGTPASDSCASRRRFHNEVMNEGVEFVRNPVRFICIFLGSGVWRKTSQGELPLKHRHTHWLLLVL